MKEIGAIGFIIGVLFAVVLLAGSIAITDRPGFVGGLMSIALAGMSLIVCTRR